MARTVRDKELGAKILEDLRKASPSTNDADKTVQPPAPMVPVVRAKAWTTQ